MDASRSLRAFSVVPSSNPSHQESKKSIRAAEAEVSLICARAGVSYVGIAADRVVFQPVGTSLSIPLSAFADAAKAVALIRAKLAEVRR